MDESGDIPAAFNGTWTEGTRRLSATLAESLDRRHINAIESSLSPTPFDVDEEAVHHRRGGFIVEAFVSHDGARGIADRDGRMGLFERLASTSASPITFARDAGGWTGIGLAAFLSSFVSILSLGLRGNAVIRK
jgi:hypothetical protein